jgi:hypothetical protein
VHYSKGSGPQGHYVLSTGKWLPIFQRIVMPPSSSGSGSLRSNAAVTTSNLSALFWFNKQLKVSQYNRGRLYYISLITAVKGDRSQFSETC